MKLKRITVLGAALMAAAVLLAGSTSLSPAAASGPANVKAAAPSLHVSGNHLVNARGQRVVLHGVDRSGGEYQCVHGFGFWDGPMGQTSINAMKSWHINAVRVPLNEACWNGESYVLKRFRGAPYRKAVTAYVRLLSRNGLVAILDLHWSDGLYTGPASGCGSAQATCQKPMPDAAQSVPFWTSVARTFKGTGSVIFDLFNEPFPNNAPGATENSAWHCWLHGGQCAGIGYKVAGMQRLVDAVRATGAHNVIMLGGIAFSNDLGLWVKHKPADPDHNLAASWHSYNFNTCSNESCWAKQVAPVIRRVPVIAGEIGENDCAHGYIDSLMNWLDSKSTSYLAWTWNADFDCASGPGLITKYTGVPTNFGVGYRAHLRSLR